MKTIFLYISFVKTRITKLFMVLTFLGTLTLVTTSCRNDLLNKKIDPDLTDFTLKDSIAAPAQSLTIHDVNRARLYNSSGLPDAFNIELSTHPDDTGLSIFTSYKIENPVLDDNIKSLNATTSGNYVIHLKSANFQLTMSGKTSEALLTDKINKMSYKTLNVKVLMWETITVEDVQTEQAAKQKCEAFLNSLADGNSKFISVSSGGVNKQVVVDGNNLTVN